jgi:hypothetical protein
MISPKLNVAFLTILTSISVSLPANADSRKARCSYYLKGEDSAQVSMPCTFSQRQGNVSIQWKDGVRNDFRLLNAKSGQYVDKRGGEVRRENGLGQSGTVFRMEKGSIFVYWQ